MQIFEMMPLKSYNQMMLEYIDKNYKEYRGAVIRKYRDIFRRYVLVIEANGEQAKVRVGKWIYLDTELGATLTVGVLNGKLINIRPGICKNADA